MRKSKFKKGLVLAVIVLFVGVSLTPLFNQVKADNNNSKNINLLIDGNRSNKNNFKNLKNQGIINSIEPGPLLSSVTYSINGVGWKRVDLTNPVTIDSDKDIWVSFKATNGYNEYPMGADQGPAVDEKGDWIYNYENPDWGWYELQYQPGDPYDCNYNIEAIIKNNGGNEVTIYYYNQVNSDSFGINGGGTAERAIRLTPTELSEYNGWELIAARFFHNESGSLSGELKIYGDGGTGNFDVTWSYPPSKNYNYQIEMNEPYSIKLTAKNPQDYSQTFRYGLSNVFYTPRNAFWAERWPDWELGLTYDCKLNGNPYEFNTVYSENIEPGETKEYIFEISNEWHWLEPWDPGRLPTILYMFDPTTYGLDMIFLIDAIFNTNPIVEFYYAGLEDSSPSSGGSVAVWTRGEKVGCLTLSLASLFLSSSATGLGLLLSETIIGAIIGFAIEASLWAGAEYEYSQADDPDSNYDEFVNPRPTYLPTFDEDVPEEFIEMAELASKFPSISEACLRAYAKYLGAYKAGSTKWTAIQSAATKYYFEMKANISNQLNQQFNSVFPDIPPLTPENISDIRFYLLVNGLPEIEIEILKYYNFTDEEIDEITQFYISAEDEFYYDIIDNSSEIFKNHALSQKFSFENFSNSQNDSFIADIGINPASINLTNPSGSIECFLEFYNVSNLSNYIIDSALLNNMIEPNFISAEPGDYNNNNIPDILIEYDAVDVVNILEEGHNLISIFGDISTSNDTFVYSGSGLLSVEGLPPNTPAPPEGSSSTYEKIPHSYSVSTIDPEDSQIYYRFDWGDGNLSKWIGPYNSGETAELEYAWQETGEYSVKVKAKDAYETESDWSEPLVVDIQEFQTQFAIILGSYTEKINYNDIIIIKPFRVYYLGFRPFVYTYLENEGEIIITETILEIFKTSNMFFGIYNAAVLLEETSPAFRPFRQRLARRISIKF